MACQEIMSANLTSDHNFTIISIGFGHNGVNMMLISDADRENAVTLTKGGLDGTYYSMSLEEVMKPGHAKALLPNYAYEAENQYRVMVVDDEDMILLLLQSILEKRGYQVDLFSNPVDAVAAFEEHPFQYQLLITDQRMPDMSGTELISKIHHIKQTVPVIMCSGYSREVTHENVKKLGIDEFLEKPVSYDKLCGTVEKVLNSYHRGVSSF